MSIVWNSCAPETEIGLGFDNFSIKRLLEWGTRGKTSDREIVPCKYSYRKKWLVLLKLCSCSYEVHSVCVWFPRLPMREFSFGEHWINITLFSCTCIYTGSLVVYILYIWLLLISAIVPLIGLDWVEGYKPGLGPGNRLSWDRCYVRCRRSSAVLSELRERPWSN